MGRLQQLACAGTLLLGLFLVVLADGEMAAFGWFVAAVGLLGLLAMVMLTKVTRRDR